MVYLHKQTVIIPVYFITVIINSIPVTKGISRQYSPREIVTQRSMDFKKILAGAELGSYIEASQDPTITITMDLRTHDCMVLGPSGNEQGSRLYFHLKTGSAVTRRTVTEVPMPDRVKKKIHKWGDSKKYRKHKGKIEFLNRTKDELEWENDDIPD